MPPNPIPALYDPGQVLLSFAGNPIVGFAEDSFVTVTPADDSFKTKIGADGSVARTRSRNKSGEITIRLMATSPSNDVFTAMFHADQQTGTGIAPFGLSDRNGRTLVGAPFAWVKRLPDVEFGNEVGEYEWTLSTGYLEATIGGNI